MTTTKTFFRGTCERGHTTDYPYESPFALCEEVESGPAVLWRCAADCYGLKRNCGGKLVKFQMLIRDSSNDPMENEGAMTGRILDANDIENFKTFYSLGKRDFWPPTEAVVRDIKCLLKTVDALQAELANRDEIRTALRKFAVETIGPEDDLSRRCHICSGRGPFQGEVRHAATCVAR